MQPVQETKKRIRQKTRLKHKKKKKKRFYGNLGKIGHMKT